MSAAFLGPASLTRLSAGAQMTGSYGRALLDGEGEGLSVEPWQVGLAIAFTIAALLYIGKVAKTVSPLPICLSQVQGP